MPDPSTSTADDDLEERAALVEEGCGVPRRWAEGFAALCTMPPPAEFLPSHWERVVKAAGEFLDKWAAEASRLGWSDLDLFGCHPVAPIARHGYKGLVVLLSGFEIEGIDEKGADLVVTTTGARQRFYRHPAAPGAVSLWELVR